MSDPWGVVQVLWDAPVEADLPVLTSRMTPAAVKGFVVATNW
jgi:hypothetical protein